jgi:hypothetical protein
MRFDSYFMCTYRIYGTLQSTQTRIKDIGLSDTSTTALEKLWYKLIPKVSL